MGGTAGAPAAQGPGGTAGVAHGGMGLEWGQGRGQGWSAGSFPGQALHQAAVSLQPAAWRLPCGCLAGFSSSSRFVCLFLAEATPGVQEARSWLQVAVTQWSYDFWNQSPDWIVKGHR